MGRPISSFCYLATAKMSRFKILICLPNLTEGMMPSFTSLYAVVRPTRKNSASSATVSKSLFSKLEVNCFIKGESLHFFYFDCLILRLVQLFLNNNFITHISTTIHRVVISINLFYCK